jgi:hypothetical protein
MKLQLLRANISTRSQLNGIRCGRRFFGEGVRDAAIRAANINSSSVIADLPTQREYCACHYDLAECDRNTHAETHSNTRHRRSSWQPPADARPTKRLAMTARGLNQISPHLKFSSLFRSASSITY